MVKRFLREITPLHVLYRILIGDIDLLGYISAWLTKPTYTVKGTVRNGFIHLYNNTFTNERCVEIPIICNLAKIDTSTGDDVLEVGNVLSHYFPLSHDIVDKFEKGNNVINTDIVEYSPKKQYRAIVSISTFEHIGFDDDVIDQNKVIEAFNHAKTLLQQDGIVAITMPIGYNPHITQHLETNAFGFSEMIFLKRISKKQWIETSLSDVKNIKYDSPFPRGNAIVVGIWRK
ncbi:MAG: hypothetical protein M0R68_12480 [Bacteroidetes bacterium]|nr:hypothetical protein [Bacteroidota bacterium]